MNPEIHLIVLWANARKAEARILADVPKHVEIVARLELSWPGRAENGYQEFYGTYLPDARRKVREAGAGPFLALIVRDLKPRYAYRRTERGMEWLNERIYQMKRRYRNWIGGSHIVHATNSTEEAEHDIWLLTGSTPSDWESGAALARPPRVTPGRREWESLREVFETLGHTVPYVVLRGYDHLPDDYARERDADIDLLVADCRNAAWVLHARKVYPQWSWRPHYEIRVKGEPVRLDLRSIGDGYYCEAWERDLLARRVWSGRGFFVPSAEDAFPSLAYHAVLQKKIATPNLEKVFALARRQGVVPDVASVLAALDAFMSARGYRFTRPTDRTVYYNETLVKRGDVSSEARDVLGVVGLRPSGLPDQLSEGQAVLPKFRFRGTVDGVERTVEYATKRSDTFDTEFRAMEAFHRAAAVHALRPLTWRMSRRGAFLIAEAASGRTLSALLAERAVDAALADCLAASFVGIAEGLKASCVVHRDIQPRNILVTDDGRVRLVGFDLAVLRASYRKEKKFVRKNFRALLERLGGKYAFRPGFWNDGASLTTILAELPQTEGVCTAVERIAALNLPSLRVRPPTKERLSAFGRWLRLSLAAALRPHARSTEKNRIARQFARAVVGF